MKNYFLTSIGKTYQAKLGVAMTKSGDSNCKYAWSFGLGMNELMLGFVSKIEHTYNPVTTPVGKYPIKLIVNNGKCIATAEQTVEIVTTTEINEASSLNAETHLYPNPSSGIVNLDVKAEKAGDFSIQISNSVSQIIISEEIKQATSFSKNYKLEKGVYLVRIQSENKFKILKLIVE